MPSTHVSPSARAGVRAATALGFLRSCNFWLTLIRFRFVRAMVPRAGLAWLVNAFKRFCIEFVSFR